MSSNRSNQNLQDFWKQHIQAQNDSGLSKASYCRENSVTYHQFIYWASKFSAEAETSKDDSSPSASKLVPVMLSDRDVPSGLQLRLPNGVLISGISAQSVGMVGRLIEQL